MNLFERDGPQGRLSQSHREMDGATPRESYAERGTDRNVEGERGKRDGWRGLC